MNAPLATYQDAMNMGKGFCAVRAYDPDQVDSLCIEAPGCSQRSGLGIDNHDFFCPMFNDYSSANEPI